jgi:predicted nucleic acid-binding protein
MTRSLAEDVYAIHLEAPLDTVSPPNDALLATALTFRTTVYDAAFIALSLTYDCPLVTAERTTTPWVTKLGDKALVVR